ncbi:unnamed protein product [Urochloa humidicola]
MLPAAIGYGGPSAQKELLTFNYGRSLVELISIRASSRGRRRPPCGTVSVFDGKRGQIVYHRQRGEAPSISTTSQAEDVLLLTGPYRAISAEGSISIELDLYDERDQEEALDSKHKRKAASRIGKIFWDAYSDNPSYDNPIIKKVGTRYGPVEVTYIVWSNAAEGSVEVSLPRRNGGDTSSGCVHGRIAAALSSAPDTAVMLFDSNSTCAMLREGGLAAVPLAKSVIAVPLMQSLTITVHLLGQSGQEIVSGSLEFVPRIDKEDEKNLVGANGEVQVTITWSD